MGDGKNQLIGDRLLAQLSIDPGADGLGRGLGKGLLRHDTGAHGRKAVQALAEIPLLMAGLEIPGRHVVDNGIAEHIVKGLRLRDVFCIPSQDHRQLRLIIQAVHQVKVAGDGGAGAGAVGGPLGKVDRLGLFPGEGRGVKPLGLRLVLLIVHPQADHILPGMGNGGEHLDLRQGKLARALARLLQHPRPVVRPVCQQVVHGLIGQRRQPARAVLQTDQRAVLPGNGV